MTTIVRLTVLTGPHEGNRFCFRAPRTATLGRAPDCDICFCGDNRDLCISRKHCRLTFVPPELSVEDLGSANGTYVNGHRCQAAPRAELAEAIEAVCISRPVRDGDIVAVGGTSLQVNMVECESWQGENGIVKNCSVAC